MEKNNEYTPMINQYLEVKKNYQDTLLFFRLGDFYELFFEDALLASSILEIQLTEKSAGNNQKIPMCGVPYHASKNYINKLVKQGHKVAIAEQLEEANTKGIVKRDVVRIVTPGVNTEDDLLNSENNYLVSVLYKNITFYISYLDITTGETYLENVTGDTKNLVNTLLRLNTKEIVVSLNLKSTDLSELISAYQININYSEDFSLRSVFKTNIENLSTEEIETYALLTNYVLQTQKQNLSHLQIPKKLDEKRRMLFDRFSIKNLELIENLRTNNKKSSLFWYLDRTKTAFGSRFLRREIEMPLTDKVEIVKRHDILEYLINDFLLAKELSELLQNIYDLERIIGRLSFGSINPKEIDQLKNSLNIFPKFNTLSTKSKNNDLSNLLNSIKDIENLRDLLNNSINDNPPLSIKDLDVIKDGFNKELDELRFIKKNSNEFLLKLEENERERTGIKNLKVGYNRIFGYYFEISKGQINQVKDEFGYIRKQTLANCERYINAELKEKEAVILNAVEKIAKLEQNIFSEIREIAKKYIVEIQENAKIIALIDMLLAFKTVSDESNLVRASITSENIINVKDAFHPVLEKLNTNYIKNDFSMNKSINTLLITGPNMSGKSTYMRNLCLIVIMNQIGCFIPASFCEIKIFDKIFTRIGASDDLVGGKSTFMVEMDEVNHAISNATKDSLIIFDEIGRGTATYDGMALAQSILEYVSVDIECKTLFSTHYHELTTLENYLGTLKNVHVSAKEEAGKIVFFHKIKDGAIDKSYGINVASLANIPQKVIKRSKTILKELEKNNVEINLFNSDILEEEIVYKKSEVLEKLKLVNTNTITGLEALNILETLKKEAENEDL